MKRAIFLAMVILLASCATRGPDRVVTKDVNIAVAQPCTVDTKKKRPALLATREELWAALSAAPNVDTRAKIVTNQLLAYMGWLPVTEAAMAGCKMAPKGP